MRVLWSMTESLKAHFVQRERTGGGGQRERDKDQRGSRTLPPRSRESVAPLLHHQRPQPDQPYVPVFSQGEPVGPPDLLWLNPVGRLCKLIESIISFKSPSLIIFLPFH